MDTVLDPDTHFINHKIGPPDKIVRWLALPEHETPLKQKKGVGRLIAMDWGNYPVSTSPAEVRERKDTAESNTGSNTSGKKAKKTLQKLIGVGPEADFPRVFAARYQSASSLRSGALVGSIGPLPNKDWEATYRGKILLVIAREGSSECSDDTPCEVLDIVPVPADIRQDESTGDGVVDLVREKANDEATKAIDKITTTGLRQEADTETVDKKVNDLDYYVLQAVELNRDSNWIRYRDFPLFASIQHRGTTNGWNKGSDHLRAAYSITQESDLAGLDDFYERVNDEGELIHPSGIGWSRLRANNNRSEINGPVALLSDGQLETLSNEFLRSGAPINTTGEEEPQYSHVHNTYPTGGSLTDVDILAAGIATEDGASVEFAAQVSFEIDSHRDKISRLASWRDGITEEDVSQEVWYFGPEAIANDIYDTELNDDRFIPIKNLPELFRQSEYLDETIVSDIFRVPPTEQISMPEK